MTSDGMEFVYAAYSITVAVLIAYTATLLWKISKRRREVAALEAPALPMEESHV